MRVLTQRVYDGRAGFDHCRTTLKTRLLNEKKPNETK